MICSAIKAGGGSAGLGSCSITLQSCNLDKHQTQFLLKNEGSSWGGLWHVSELSIQMTEWVRTLGPGAEVEWIEVGVKKDEESEDTGISLKSAILLSWSLYSCRSSVCLGVKGHNNICSNYFKRRLSKANDTFGDGLKWS